MTNEKQTPHLDKTRLAWCPTAHASRTHHEKQQEQEAALKLELRKKAEQEKREKWYRKRRQSRWKNRGKKHR